MNVGTICSKPIRSVEQGKTVREASMLMLEHHVGCLLVVSSSGEPVGMITDRDIVIRCIAKEFDPDLAAVREIMSAPVEAVPEDAMVEVALEHMARWEVRRLLVNDPEGRPVGIVSLDDLLLAEHHEEVGGILSGLHPV